MTQKLSTYLIIILLLFGCNSENSSSAKDSVAYKLASIDANEHLNHDDRRIPQYKDALNSLTARFKLSETDIGDKTVFIVKKLKRNQINSSVLEIMQAVISMKESSDLGMSYDETLVILSRQMLNK